MDNQLFCLKTVTHSEAVYPIVELTSSGLTHINEIYGKAANIYRIAGPYIDLNFGLVEIDWHAKPSPEIALKIVSKDGETSFSHKFLLSELRR